MGKRLDKPFWDARRRAVWIPGAGIWLDGRDLDPAAVTFPQAEELARTQERTLPTRRDWLAVAFRLEEVNGVLRRNCACPLTKTYWSQTSYEGVMKCRYAADFSDGTVVPRGETCEIGVRARGCAREEREEGD